MNELSIINQYLIDLFDSMPLVNTISIVPTSLIDVNQENIYQLVNIDLFQDDVNESQVIAGFIITVVQQRNKVPNKTDSKLMTDSNYLDNLNETHSTMQKFINSLLLQNNSLNIEIETQSKIKILKEWSRSNLDGCQITVELSIPNKGQSC